MRTNENMSRKHNWDQLQIIQKKIDKQGGDISAKLKGDYKRQSKTANSYWINNPINKDIALSDNEPNANIHTDPQLKDLPKNSIIKKFEAFAQEDEIYDRQVRYGINPEIQIDKFSQEISDSQDEEITGDLPIGREDDMSDYTDISNIFTASEYTLFQKLKDEDFQGSLTLAVTGEENPSEDDVIGSIKSLDDETKEELLNESKKEITEMKEKEEKQDRGNVNDIHRNMKTIRNWNNYFTDAVGGNPKAEQPRNVLAGRQVDFGEDKEGYIEDVQGDKVIIQATDNTGHKVKSFSEVTKMYKIEKGNKENKGEELKGPKENIEISSNGEVKELKDKSTETDDSKSIGDQIYKTGEVKIKKLQDFGKTTF